MKHHLYLVSIATLVLFPSFLHAQDYTSNLVAYFPFNGSANDASGNGNNGTAYNATLTTNRFGVANKAYAFNGSNTRIDVPDNTSLRTANVSVGAWVYYDAVPNNVQVILSKPFLSGPQESYVFYYYQSILNAYATNGTNALNIAAPATPAAGQWFHLVQTFDDANNVMKLFINGAEVGSAVANFSLAYDGAPFIMGAELEGGSLAFFFNGKIDDVRLYGRALTAADVSALYTYESQPNETVTCYADTDGDGYGNSNSSQNFTSTCGAGYVLDNTDCNDNNAAIHPGAAEIYFNGVDEDCNGMLNDNGLVGYYPFNGNANDASGTGNNGTVYNATLTTDRFGIPNAAYAFNGSSTRIEVPDNLTLRPASISQGAWVYYANVPYSIQAIIGKALSSEWHESYLIYYNAGLPNALATDAGGINGANIIAPAPPLEAGQWIHLAQVFDDAGNTMKLYVNGMEAASAPANFSLNFDGSPFLIGADLENNSLAFYFGGKIDEVKIYNHALSATEVLAWYQEPAYAGPDKPICAGTSTTLTASAGSSYLWSTGATTATITVTPASTTTYTVTITNALGVQSTDEVTITVVPALLYVNKNATGANNGSSWADAYTDLGDALKVAQCGEIWVAEGIYHPKYNYTYDLPGNPRNKTFSLKKDVDVYGGFAGNETNRSDRNWNAHPTILSGDLDNDDALVSIDNLLGESTRMNNAGHVLTAYNTGGTTILDGFFITAGNSHFVIPDFPTVHQGDGGAGLIVAADYGATTTVNVNNCRFYRNSSYWGGGAVANQAGLNSNGISTVNLTNCTFSGNRATYGAAVWSFSHHNGSNYSTIKNCAFTQNVGISTLSNSKFSGFETCLMSLVNNILWGNTGGNAVAADAPTYYIHNDIQSGLDVGAYFGNISADPLFTDPNGADDVIGTADDDLTLQGLSPCKNTGDPGATYPDFDLAHNDRTVGNPDMGAYELQGPVLTCYLDSDNDTYGNPALTNICYGACDPGYVINAADCNDNNAAIHPGATEICNGYDDDCDGLTDLDDPGVLLDGLAKATVKLFLQGPYVSNVQLMHDSLRVKGLIPLQEPYTGLTNFTHTGGGGGEQTTPAVLAISGPNAIVDWVFLELRSAADPIQVLATRSALLQRDGDVVGVDGASPVTFGVAADQSYYLAARHRNHLGVQLGAAVFYPQCAIVHTDFSVLPPESFYTFNGLNPAEMPVGGKYVLWASNGRIDFQLKYNGSNNDRTAVLAVVGLNTPNASVPGYLPADYNMDGVVKYNGSANDRNVLLGNVGIATPSAVLYDQVAR